MKIFYKTRATATGGRSGRTALDDGSLALDLATPGSGKTGANPEQLFAAGYAACFMGALKFVAGQSKVSLPADAAIDAEVDIGPIPHGFGIAVRMKIALPGMDRAAAQKLVDAAHGVCPYSNATRGNIQVELTLV